MDTIKGLALIGTFIGVLIIFAMWVSLWENVWQASVEPTRGAIYDSTQSPWPFALPSLNLDVVAVGGLSADIVAPFGVVVVV
jgi:hypothetical protein